MSGKRGCPLARSLTEIHPTSATSSASSVFALESSARFAVVRNVYVARESEKE